MHVIVGKGNLGIDLKLALTAAGHRAVILTRSAGFKWPESYPDLMDLAPTHVWVTAGYGSVFECAANFTGALATHTAMPIELARNLPEKIKVGLFSTDYVADPYFPDQEQAFDPEPKTFYALSKLWMEHAAQMLERPNLSVFRICSLYGQHYPEKTFPGKLLARYSRPGSFSLPENEVCPTPTWWIAQTLVSELDVAFIDEPKIYHLAPSGSTTTLEWGRRIMGPEYEISSSGLDPLRPFKSGLRSSFEIAPINWLHLWEQSKIFFTGIGTRQEPG